MEKLFQPSGINDEEPSLCVGVERGSVNMSLNIFSKKTFTFYIFF